MYRPLADKIRPTNLDEVVGQSHLLGEKGILRRIINSTQIPNMIFYGPSGIGKTTVAEIIAKATDKKLYRLNATSASIADIKSIIDDLDTLLTANGVLIYLDEIQYFNKKQQQSLLEFIENGKITLIASTTENPYFYVYNAILSRSTIFEFKPLLLNDIKKALRRGFMLENTEVSNEIIDYISASCGGDMRKALNTAEILINSREGEITLDDTKVVAQRSNMRYDRDGDQHYDILSALQKSIRGSDPDAAVHYLARLIAAGDIISAARRLLVIASEDIGLANPNAITIVKSCVDSAFQLGLPEARIPLAQATLYLATSPKSNSANVAIDSAMADLTQDMEIPSHLKDSHYNSAEKLGRGVGYKYPHSYPNSFVKQQYLPNNLKNKKYYNFGNNKMENAAKDYWDKIKK